MKFNLKNTSWLGLGLVLTLISTSLFADAPKPEAGMGSGMMAQVLMLVAFGFVFYFLILRPQSKRAKQHRDLVSGLQKGDEVITSGGILGKIARLTDDFLVLNIADGIEVVIQKQSIAGSVPKGTLKSI